MINTIMGFAVTINIGVLAFLFAEFVRTGGFRPGFILIGGAISAATVALWRLYTRYLDDNIADLYSEIFYYERELGIPQNMGISKYISTHIKVNREFLDKKAIEELYEEKQLGSRGHRKLEQLSLAYVCGLLVIELVVLNVSWRPLNFCTDWINGSVYLVCLLVTIATIVILKCRKWRYQIGL
jgi:hypothetical protein